MAIDLTRFDPAGLSTLHIARAGGARHTLLNRNGFHLRSALVETSLGGIIHGQYSADMRVQQGVPAGMYFVGFIFGVRGRFLVDGAPLTGGDLVVFPPGTEVGAIMRADFEWGMLLVPTHVMRERMIHFVGRDVEAIVPQKRVISATEAGPELMRRQTEALIRLRRVANSSSTATTVAEDGKDWMEDALQIFLETPLAETKDRRVRPYAVFRRVEEYLEAHAHRPIYMHELCAAAGVSGRHVRAAFSEVLGIPPNRYLELIRLSRARDSLRTSPSVKYAALSTGNTHLPRFSQHYARLFGEKPSGTFRRERDLRE